MASEKVRWSVGPQVASLFERSKTLRGTADKAHPIASEKGYSLRVMMYVNSRGKLAIAKAEIIPRKRSEIVADVAALLQAEVGSKKRESKRLADMIVTILEEFGYPTDATL